MISVMQKMQTVEEFTKQNEIQYKTQNLMVFTHLGKILRYFGGCCSLFLPLPGYLHAGTSPSGKGVGVGGGGQDSHGKEAH